MVVKWYIFIQKTVSKKIKSKIKSIHQVVTKSFVSALVSIAMNEGYIKELLK
jgi:hypothetical protein